MGVMKVGFLTTYLSEPLTRAFTTGAAIHVMSSQLKHVFGVNPKKFNGSFKIIYVRWGVRVGFLGFKGWVGVVMAGEG